jgi:hypothetical protein
MGLDSRATADISGYTLVLPPGWDHIPERITAPDPSHDTELPSRCVDYILSVPGDPGRWVLAAFYTFGGGDPDDGFAKLLVELFDAIISTFRWKASSRQHTEGEPR